MNITDIPTKVTVPFANAADSDHKRVVPVTPPVEVGAASYTDGFPDANFQPPETGGIPPFGKDFNGLENNNTAWLRWMAACGPIKRDPSFQTAISGYPRGARILLDNHDRVAMSLTDGNTSDPNALGSTWVVCDSVWSSANWVAAGSANVQTLTLSPTPANLAALHGVPLQIRSVGTNSGAVTLNVNGLGNVSIRDQQGAFLLAGAVITNFFYTVMYNSVLGVFQMMSQPLIVPYVPPFTPVQQGGGAGQFNNKIYIGFDGVSLRGQIDVTDWGRFVMERDIAFAASANGFLQNGRAGNNGARCMFQWWFGSIPAVTFLNTQVQAIPTAFPTACLWAGICFAGSTPPVWFNNPGIAIAPVNRAQVIVSCGAVQFPVPGDSFGTAFFAVGY